MKRIENSSGSLSDKIQDVIDHKDEVSDFTDTDYDPVYALKEIEEAVEKIREVEKMIEEKSRKLENLDIQEKEELISEKESKIKEMKSSEEWNKKKDIEEEIEELEDEKNDLNSSLSSDIAELERGLKKLLYSIENSDVDFEGDRDVLRKLKNGVVEVKIDGELEEASKVIEENSLLNGRQLSKFKDATDQLDDLDERRQELNEIEDEIEGKKRQLSELDVDEELKSISSETERLEKDLEKKKDRKQKLEEEIESLREEKQNRIKRLEAFISEILGVEAQITQD